MKPINLHFFSPSQNSPAKGKSQKAAKPTKVVLTGYISSAGKLVFPAKTVAQLGVDVDKTAFRVGMQAGKRKAKSLYLVPADEQQAETFPIAKAAKSYTVSLPFILKKSGVDFPKRKYTFVIRPFEYEGTNAWEL